MAKQIEQFTVAIVVGFSHKYLKFHGTIVSVHSQKQQITADTVLHFVGELFKCKYHKVKKILSIHSCDF